MTTPSRIEIPPGDFAGYIFDLDGTLADSMPIHFKAWTETLERLTGQPSRFTEALFYSMGGVPAREIIAWLNKEHGYSLPIDDAAYQKEAAFVRFIPDVMAIPSVIAALQELPADKPKAIASGGLKHIVLDTLDVIGLRDQFKAIVASDDVQRGKPAPDMFLLAAELMGVEPTKCLVFEDGAAGFAAARAAGMQFVDVRPYYQTAEVHVANTAPVAH